MLITLIILSGIILIIALVISQTTHKDISQNLSDNLFFTASEASTIEILIQSDNFEGVITISDKILNEKPKCFQALVTKAIALERLNYNLDSLDIFQDANSIFDKDPEVLGLLALTYKKVGDWDNAEKYLKKSVEIDPTKYGHHLNILSNTPTLTKEILIEKAKISENFHRRK